MENKANLGTAPVFFTAISTILGAIMFLRFGFAVGMIGLTGTILLVLIGHAVTIPTAMAIAEIATNQKVEGGGEYYIISRSFGQVIGSTIGVALYLSQSISVAFYIIAFTEAFKPVMDILHRNFIFVPWLDWILRQSQTIAIPALFILVYIVLVKGTSLGLKTLYFVVGTLVVSLLAFFLGHPVEQSLDLDAAKTIENVSFFTVFAIIFPAFTGMTAGVGLSGDLKDPGRSIPLGTLSATIIGMIIYLAIAVKLDNSASKLDLIDTSRLIMAEIAVQGYWVIPLGLAAATISSAIGSILVAPRTLQAIGKDRTLPIGKMNTWLSLGEGQTNEPVNATKFTFVIALFFILIGALDAVAEIISMFFMVTYGSLCLISFLQHFAADPAYRPKFKSKWYISLFGAIASFGLMFLMNPVYAFFAVLFIILLYFLISFYNSDKKNLALIFQGVIFQISRKIHIFLQKADKEENVSYRPSAVFLSSNTFKRLDAFNFTRWLSDTYGFGTYIHHIDGYFSKQTKKESTESQNRIIKMADASKSKVYIDTLINPTFKDSILQVIQLPSISGTENNLILFDFEKNKKEELSTIVDNFRLIQTANMDLGILSISDRQFGLKKEIHVWLTSTDFENANLMILLAYIISANKDWKGGQIKVFSVFPENSIAQEQEKLYDLITTGQLPISTNNIEFIPEKEDAEFKSIVKEKSLDADLIILGLKAETIKHYGVEVFEGYDNLCNVLFVNSEESKQIK